MSGARLRCTCKPPKGVTRNHDNGCPLFDVRAAYRQGREDEARADAALRDAATEIVHLGNQPGMDDDEWEGAMDALEAALREALAADERGSGEGPTAADLRGLAPGITGGKSSEEYVRSIRDAAADERGSGEGMADLARSACIGIHARDHGNEPLSFDECPVDYCADARARLAAAQPASHAAERRPRTIAEQEAMQQADWDADWRRRHPEPRP